MYFPQTTNIYEKTNVKFEDDEKHVSDDKDDKT